MSGFAGTYDTTASRRTTVKDISAVDTHAYATDRTSNPASLSEKGAHAEEGGERLQEPAALQRNLKGRHVQMVWRPTIRL